LARGCFVCTISKPNSGDPSSLLFSGYRSNAARACIASSPPPPPSNFEIKPAWRYIPLPCMPPHLDAGLNTGMTLPLLVYCVFSFLPPVCHFFQTSICPFLTDFGVAPSILFQIQELHKPLNHVKLAVMRTFPSCSTYPSPTP